MKLKFNVSSEFVTAPGAGHDESEVPGAAVGNVETEPLPDFSVAMPIQAS